MHFSICLVLGEQRYHSTMDQKVEQFLMQMSKKSLILMIAAHT